ncbi:hypothetical protein A6R68_23478, partial [Neotoma lepida]
MFLPLLAHRLWRLTLQILARFSMFVSETSSDCPAPLAVSEDSQEQQFQEEQGQNLPGIDMLAFSWPISNESTKETKKPLAGSKDPSEDQGSHPSEVQAASISSTQLVYVVADLDKLQEWEVPSTASSYVDSALKPFYQLHRGHGNKVKPAVMQHWLQEALSESTHKYFETVSDVLNSVKKMEESLKRLKQARRAPATNPVSSSGGMSDDDKIRLQLALDVEFLGEQEVMLEDEGLHPV